jgi:putative chitinase
MRAYEFIQESVHKCLYPQEIDEINWRGSAAALGIAGSLAGGLYSQHKDAKIKEPVAQVFPIDNLNLINPELVAPLRSSVSKESIAFAKKIMSNPNAQIIHNAAESAGIKGIELAQFMAQSAHETGNFNSLRERGSQDYFMHLYDIQYNRKNAIRLGNIYPGDGVRFIGRGALHLTGRSNYRRVGQALGINLEQHPELAERADIAARIGIYYWQHRVQPNVDDYNDTASVTKPINSSLKGLSDREDKFKALRDILTGNHSKK